MERIKAKPKKVTSLTYKPYPNRVFCIIQNKKICPEKLITKRSGSNLIPFIQMDLQILGNTFHEILCKLLSALSCCLNKHSKGHGRLTLHLFMTTGAKRLVNAFVYGTCPVISTSRMTPCSSRAFAIPSSFQSCLVRT